MEIVYRKLSELKPNPKNPRKATEGAIARLAASIKDNPKFFEARPILLSDRTGELIIIGGEQRSKAAALLKMKTVPTILIPGLDEAGEDEVLFLDNTHSGVWDEQKLAKWDKGQLQAWNVRDIQWGRGLSSDKLKKDDDYEAFIEKFEPKATTDDCFTPPGVYEIVLDWITKNICDITKNEVVRPFFPEGDYQKFDYPKECIVIDNPPFSIYTEIVRFYVKKRIKFFLFGPNLSLFTPGITDVTYIVANASIIYENGASVSTGFVTNLIKGDDLIWVDGKMREAIQKLQKKDEQEKYAWPANVISSALLGKLCNNPNCALKILRKEVARVKNLDWCKERGKGLYGSGFLLSNIAAERVAAERVAAEVVLSEREQNIVRKLNGE